MAAKQNAGLWPEEENVKDLYQEAEEEAFTPQSKTRVFSEYSGKGGFIRFAVEYLEQNAKHLVWSDLLPEDHEWDGSPDPLMQVAEALENWEDVGVESGTGTGKSYFMALIILWFLAVWRDARVFTFAPKEDQLRLYIWAEISQLWPFFAKLFPNAVLNDLEILMEPGNEKWGAWGISVGIRAGEDIAQRAAGMHAHHMLLVYEETPGIPVPVIEAGENTCTGEHNLRVAIGNPDHTQDALHKFCTSPGVRHLRASALDHPNVVRQKEIIPGAVTLKSVSRREKKYGEGDRIYQTRVRGLCPDEAKDALIRMNWVRAAVERYNDERLRIGKRAKGIDVANSEAGDLAAVADGIGACCLEIRSFPCPDANQLARDVWSEMRADGTEPECVGVDSGGVGAGTVNEFRRLGVYVRALNAGSRASINIDEESELEEDEMPAVQAERFGNLRAQMWWQARMDLQQGNVALPPGHDNLYRELITPMWAIKSGKIYVEGKREIKKRLAGRSTDEADAFIMWNFVRDRTPPPVETKKYHAWSPEILASEEHAFMYGIVPDNDGRGKFNMWGGT